MLWDRGGEARQHSAALHSAAETLPFGARLHERDPGGATHSAVA